MTDSRNDLREMTITFALSVSDICDEIKGCRSYVDQIVRSSSSIGANLFEAGYAQSRADFIHQLEISLKECSETLFWIDLLNRSEILSDRQVAALRDDCLELRKMLSSACKTLEERIHDK